MQSLSALLNEIRQHYLAGRIDEASELCLQGLVESPNDGELHFLLALCDEKQGKADDALQRLQRVVSENRQHVAARFALGRLLVNMGQATEARNAFNDCLELDPGHAPARTVRARLDRIEGRIEEAISGLKTALRADEDHVPALVTLAELLLEQGDLEPANEQASKAVQIAPHDGSAQLVMGRVFLAKGLFSFAEQCLSNAVESDPDNPQVHLALGHALQRFGRHKEAVAAFEQARRLGLEDRQVVRGLALSLARCGRLQEARRAFETLTPQADDRHLILDLADLHAADHDAAALAALVERSTSLSADLGRWLEALRCEVAGELSEGVDLAEALFATEDVDLQVRARMLAARLHLRLDKPGALVGILEPLFEEARLTPAVHWELARLLREAGAFDAASRCLKHVAKRKDLDEETRVRTQSMRLDMLDRAGRHDEAKALFPDAAWQPPYLGEPAYLQLHGDKVQKLQPIVQYDWAGVAAQATGRTPVFVAGWPCTGRDLLLTALALSSEVEVLPLTEWPQRKQHLGLPVDTTHFDAPDSARLHLMRRRYLRFQSRDRRLVESASVQPVDMAQLARLFPGAVVVHPTAAEDYLSLQWRLMGYRQVPTMLKAWRHDGEMLDMLRDTLPVQVVDCPLEQLLEDPAATLSSLCGELGLPYDDGMREAVERLAANRGYRPAQHWKHYFPED